MSKIFELFGYRLDAWNSEARENSARARCPFMNSECDGGGNRYLSSISLSEKPHLKKYFPGKSIVQSGVCSLAVRENEQPWIVCPRRLLALRGITSPDHQAETKEELVRLSGLVPGKRYRVWSEVKMKVDTKNEADETKSFDYTFDYIVAGSRRAEVKEIAAMFDMEAKKVESIAHANGFTLAQRDGARWVDDFPADPLVIVEVMTSSTSGGDKKKRTQIAMAFEDAIIRPESHNGPGINYRQVWARMVSQLIVKSQVGLAWGGKTIWVLQDVLVDYISGTTALDLVRYRSKTLDEVNILALGYGKLINDNPPPITLLSRSQLYAGPISTRRTQDGEGGFIEIVKIGAAPPINHLWLSLFKKYPSSSLML